MGVSLSSAIPGMTGYPYSFTQNQSPQTIQTTIPANTAGGSYDFKVIATGESSTTQTCTKTLTVTSPAALPNCSLSLSPSSVSSQLGGIVTATWSTTNATTAISLDGGSIFGVSYFAQSQSP
jgi:hypothetical protein